LEKVCGRLIKQSSFSVKTRIDLPTLKKMHHYFLATFGLIMNA